MFSTEWPSGQTGPLKKIVPGSKYQRIGRARLETELAYPAHLGRPMSVHCPPVVNGSPNSYPTGVTHAKSPMPGLYRPSDS